MIRIAFIDRFLAHGLRGRGHGIIGLWLQPGGIRHFRIGRRAHIFLFQARANARQIAAVGHACAAHAGVTTKCIHHGSANTGRRIGGEGNAAIFEMLGGLHQCDEADLDQVFNLDGCRHTAVHMPGDAADKGTMCFYQARGARRIGTGVSGAGFIQHHGLLCKGWHRPGAVCRRLRRSHRLFWFREFRGRTAQRHR